MININEHGKPMKPIYIVDTNVLLDDPHVIYSFHDVEIVIPQGVLVELDKLKTMRTDGRLRFHGREISRMLFQLAQEHLLTDGVELKNNSIIRVANYDQDIPIPETLKTKNTDDQLLALAYQLTQSNADREVLLITSDLNMLLRAQSLGLKIRHFEEVYRPGFFRTVWNQLRLKSRTLVWFVPLIVAIVMVVFFYPRDGSKSQLSPELLKTLTPQQLQYYKYIEILKENPEDIEALGWLGDYYVSLGKHNQAIEYYNNILKIEPDETIYRTRRGASFYYMKDFDKAVADLREVTGKQPDYAEAHFWLGMVQYYGFDDANSALAEFNIYLQIEPEGPRAGAASQQIQVIEAQSNQ